MSLQSELAQGQLRAADDTVVVGGIAGLGGIAVDLSGTWVGTVTFEGQIASGAWTALNMVRSNGSTVVTTATSIGLFIGSCVGLTAVRARLSAYTSGIVAVSLQASLASAGSSGGGGGGGGGAVTIADGADVVEGELADAAIVSSAVGTVNGKLRGLIALQNPLDYDTGGGTAPQGIVGIALAGSGGPVGVSGSNPLPVTGTVATGGLTDTQLRATPVPISGTVTASGPLTDTQLRATPVPVSGTVTASGPLTDTQLRATPVPVSGTVTTGGLTDTQLRASAVPITGSGTAGTAAAGVQTVQGIASMTPVQVSQATAASLNATVTGSGSAGTAAAGVVTIQGIASMTKLLVTPDANSAVNVAQINGVTPLMGAGNSGTGAQRVSISTDDINLAAINAVSGTTAGAAVITDANGTIQQYLRGLVKLAITAGSFLVTATLGAGSALIGYVGFKSTYAAKVTLTTTNFSGLTNTSGWQSSGIATSGARDVQFNLTTLGAAGSTAYVDFYVAEKFNSGTWTDGATGSEGTFTAANRKNARYLGSILCNGTTSVPGFGPKLSDIFTTMPENVALIAINNSGGTISATGGNTVFEYELVN